MKIEGPKILGKIDLEKQEKQKINHRAIRERAFFEIEKEQFENINTLRAFLGATGAPKFLVNEKGSLSGEMFKESRGGPYKDVWVGEDILQTNEIEQKAFQKNEMKDGHFAERVVPLILNKILIKNGLIMLNTHSYDDLEHGVDQVVFDIQTGDAICALDEMVANDELIQKNFNKKDTRFNKKTHRILEKKKNGVSLKYGVHFKNGAFQGLGSLKNLPLSVMRVERKLFYEAMRDMDFSIESDLCDSEKKLLHYILQSLEDQIENFSQKVDVSYESVKKFVQILQEKIT